MFFSNDSNEICSLLEALENIETPAFVLSEEILKKVLRIAAKIQNDTGSHVLYAMKPLVNEDAMRTMNSYLKGFSASSLYEAKFAREIIGSDGLVHITTPGYRQDEMSDLSSICDCIVLNSLSQYSRFAKDIAGKSKIGLRINPQLSLINDSRYNPCRENSKLGVPMNILSKSLEDNQNRLQYVSGVHFHTNCDSITYSPLVNTINHISLHLDGLLRNLDWINLGGGYLLNDDLDFLPLYEAIKLLQNKYNLKVYFEPGAAFVRKAGFIVSSVIDLFDGGDGNTIAILDTSVNHMQEIFEYQSSPMIHNNTEEGSFKYVLSGSTCLSGDAFGTYHFIEPLEIGSKVIFKNMGSYTLVKAHMFNGIKLPNLYWLNSQNECLLRKRITYQDYLLRI